MNSLWKWCGLAACGLGLLVGLDRMSFVTAAEDRPSFERPGDTSDRLDRISAQLERLLDRMEMRRGPGGPPPHGDHAGPPRGPGRDGHEGHRGRPEWGGPQRELPPEVRERMQQAREEMKERMEKAREKFRELEDRVKALEAEVERLKAGRTS